MSIFRCGKYVLDFTKKTYVMGILNVTPDSFSDGGEYNTVDLAVSRALEMEKQGADIIDIGAQSTRPGHKKITIEEELKRLNPVLSALRGKLHIPISVDTFYSEVAKESLNYGVSIINYVTGFKNDSMFEVAKKSDCGCILVHDVAEMGIKYFFESQYERAMEYGIVSERLCFDPGIGFNKTYQDDIGILRNVEEFRVNDIGILVGASRKRVIGVSSGNPEARQRVVGTIAAHTIAILGGANIVRVHDVKEAVEAVRVTDSILRGREEVVTYG